MNPTRPVFLLLVLVACGPTSEPLDTVDRPEPATCLFEASLSGGLTGSLTVEEQGCGGSTPSENSPYYSSYLDDGAYGIQVKFDGGLILSEGASFDDVKAHVVITNRSDSRSWPSQDSEPCVAQIDDLVIDTEIIGEALFAVGAVECSRLWGPTVAEDAVLTDGTFYVQIGD